MYVTAIVLAAGKGLRFESKVPKSRHPEEIPRRDTAFGISKPLIEINSKPTIIYSLNILSRHPYIRDIIVVVNINNLKGLIRKIKQYRIKKIKDVVLGGRQRQNSVINGLGAIDERTDLILIHDGVRPFIDKEIISKVIKEADIFGAAIVGVPVKATIKEVYSPQCPAVHSKILVKRTLNRKRLWEVQTPQVFKKELILKAYNKCANREVTDDASLVERLGAKVKIVMGSYANIKITTPEDLILAEAIAKKIKTKIKAKQEYLTQILISA